jgi:hypothetical protein
MSQSQEPISPFLEDEDALAVAAVINRFAASFDAKKQLSPTEARVIYVLAIRIIDELMRAYGLELMQLTMYALTAGEPEPDDSN